MYEGEWKKGVRSVRGKYTYADGDVYEGEYKDDQPNGRGKYTWADGRVYEGEFKDGKRHGHGYMYDTQQRRSWSGTWRNDEYVG